MGKKQTEKEARENRLRRFIVRILQKVPDIFRFCPKKTKIWNKTQSICLLYFQIIVK